MKHKEMACPGQRLQSQRCLTCARSATVFFALSAQICLAALLFFVCSAQAQLLAVPLTQENDVINPPEGGPGGSPFVARCPHGRYLTGFEIRGGALVDAIRPICVVVYGPSEAGPLEPYPTMIGGPGGSTRQLLCPREFPMVKTVSFGWKLYDPAVIQDIHLVCGTAAAGDVKEQFDESDKELAFFGSDYSPHINPDYPTTGYSIQGCGGPPDHFKGTTVGITGRSGEWLDALGVICNKAAEFTAKPVALGRVVTTTPAPPLKTMGDEAPICARARDARARNSPVASALEVQCQAAGGNFMDRKVTRGMSGTSALNAVAGSHAGGDAPSPVEKYRSMQVQSGISTLGVSAASHVGSFAPSPPASTVPPAEQPPMQPSPVAQPPVVQPTAKPGNAFMPPTFVDGAQLWACANAVQGTMKGAGCSGLQSGRMYCRRHGFSGALQARADGTPDLMVAPAQPGSPVRAVNGNACMANDCLVISELNCAP